MKYRFAWAPAALLFVSNSAAWAISNHQQAVRLPTNSVIKVRLAQTIGSDRSQTGDPFTATVDDNTFPAGTVVRGTIIGVKPAATNQPGRIGLDFRTLELPDGRRVAISGTPIALDSHSVTHTTDGRLVAKSTKNNTGKYVAIGAAGGLLIGSLLGKNVVGGLLGAGAGYLLGQNENKKAEHREVVLKQGTEMGVRLDRGVAVANAWPHGHPRTID
jgi:hypothetical protein